MALNVATSDDEIVSGTDNRDSLYSNGFNNVTLNGLGGPDGLYANGGTGGEFNGGEGNDYLSAGDPYSGERNFGGIFNGGDGDDHLHADRSAGGTFNGGSGNDWIEIERATSGILNGDDGDDQFLGNWGENGTFEINGGAGNDTLSFYIDINEFNIVKYEGVVLLFGINYKATITDIEYFIFDNNEANQTDKVTLENLGTNPDRVTAAAATGDDYVDGLIDGEKWIGEITYSFGHDISDQQFMVASALLRGSIDEDVGQVAHATYSLYGSVTSLVAAGISPSWPTDSIEDLDFFENDGDIKFQGGSGFERSYIAEPPSVGSITFNSSLNGTDDDLRYPGVGSYAYFVYLQAAGRALGLKSASEAGGVADVGVPADKDGLEYTVMSERSYVGGPTGDYTNGQWDFPQTFMALDIQALQAMYGADYTT
ncbi:hypothetical protein KHC28_03460, partial [Ancylobacter sonchi]|nr:hypothetical protein [Ancylobacter sonchi]